MPIKSYLTFSHLGLKDDLERSLRSIHHCEVIPSENKDVIVVVSDTQNEDEEKEFLNELLEAESLDHYTLVAGFEENSKEI